MVPLDGNTTSRAREEVSFQATADVAVGFRRGAQK